jgi:hypothetical protein
MSCLRRQKGAKINGKVFARFVRVLLVVLVLGVWTGESFVHAETASAKWVKRYDGALHLTDSMNAEYSALFLALFPFLDPNFRLMAADPSGNIFVTGTTMTSNQYDIVTMKFQRTAGTDDGKIAWKNIYDRGVMVNEFPAGITMDTEGNVYVTGISGTDDVTSDVVTFKVNGATGKIIWKQVYDGPGKYLDGPTGIAVDKNKNVYVCGFTASQDPVTKIPKYNYLTLKYNSAGIFQWAKCYDGPNNKWDMATAIAVDNSGYVYVTGASTAAVSLKSGVDIVTIKYSPAGSSIWTKIYDGPAHYFDVGRAIAVDSVNKRIFVTGESSIDAVQAMVTLQYDDVKTNTSPVWATHYKDPKGDFFSWGKALVLDAKGKPYAVGDVDNANGNDYLTIKYNPTTGKQIWAKNYNGPNTDSNDTVGSIAVDSLGNVVVTGTSTGKAGNQDVATVKYSSADGARNWAVRYNNAAVPDYDGGVAVAVYKDKTVYVAAESEGKSTDTDIALIRYNLGD